MTKTTNYQLNQWEKSDRILMDDFNADNEKIDAALALKPGRWQFIKNLSPGATDAAPKLDVSDIDWNEWETVALVYEASGPRADKNFQINVCGVNGANITQRSSTSVNSLAEFPIGAFFTLFLPWHNSENKVRSLTCAATSSFGFADAVFSEVAAIRVHRNDSAYFSPSDKFALYGVK